MHFIRLLGVLPALLAGPVLAAPMGFSGSWMAMGDFSPNWQETFANYALTPRDAIGFGATYMRSDDKHKQRDFVDLNYTRLLQRWNLPHAQANLWFFGGLGKVRLKDGNREDYRNMVSPGMQFDYETTRVYFAATGRLYRARDINHDYASVRAGFSFYEAGYEETQPWLILEARRMRGLSERTEITPMLRLINKNYFIEAGISTEKQPRFNFMYIF